MRHDRHKSAIFVTWRYANDQCWPNLRRHTQVDKPNFTPARGLQLWLSRRSYSVNTRSAASTSSWSLGEL